MTRWFDPSWSPPHPAVVAALAGSLAHGAEERELRARVLDGLGRLFGTSGPVLLFPGEATVLGEMAIRSGVAHRALALVAGAGGEALARSAEALGKEVLRLVVPPGHAVEPEYLARFIESPPVDAVLTVHAEPETGVLLPLESVARVVRAEKDVLLLVDASDSVANEPLEADRWGLDFAVAPGSRGLGGPPGVAVAVASARFLARAREWPGRGVALDPVLLCEPAGTPTLPDPLPRALLAALDLALGQLDNEPWPVRLDRIRRLRGMVDAWVERANDWRLLARPGRRAAGFSVLAPPPGVDPADLRARLASAGWRVGIGLGAHAHETIRVAHAAATTEEELGRLLECLRELGNPGQPGATSGDRPTGT